MSPPAWFSFFKVVFVLAILGLLHFPLNFRLSLSISAEASAAADQDGVGSVGEQTAEVPSQQCCLPTQGHVALVLFFSFVVFGI